MIEIQATSDTTIHTAGKYCEEDILVKVPSSESVVPIVRIGSSIPDSTVGSDGDIFLVFKE